MDWVVPREQHRVSGSRVVERFGLNDSASVLYPVTPQYLPRVHRSLYDPGVLLAGSAIGSVLVLVVLSVVRMFALRIGDDSSEVDLLADSAGPSSTVMRSASPQMATTPKPQTVYVYSSV